MIIVSEATRTDERRFSPRISIFDVVHFLDAGILRLGGLCFQLRDCTGQILGFVQVTMKCDLHEGMMV